MWKCKECCEIFENPVIIVLPYCSERVCSECGSCHIEEIKKENKHDCSKCSLFVGGICTSPNGCYYKK